LILEEDGLIDVEENGSVTKLFEALFGLLDGLGGGSFDESVVGGKDFLGVDHILKYQSI
jgi:hypothetical protein